MLLYSWEEVNGIRHTKLCKLDLLQSYNLKQNEVLSWNTTTVIMCNKETGSERSKCEVRRQCACVWRGRYCGSNHVMLALEVGVLGRCAETVCERADTRTCWVKAGSWVKYLTSAAKNYKRHLERWLLRWALKSYSSAEWLIHVKIRSEL